MLIFGFGRFIKSEKAFADVIWQEGVILKTEIWKLKKSPSIPYGGSTKYFANIMDLIGKGEVISIDVDRSVYQLDHSRVKALTGSSSDPEILFTVEELCKNKTVMVIQDGDHSKKQALEDLENYSKFVSLNSYFIMEDGIVDLFHHDDGLGFQKEGSLAAVEEFLSRNSNFVIDSSRERYILTCNPKGFLKRIF